MAGTWLIGPATRALIITVRLPVATGLAREMTRVPRILQMLRRVPESVGSRDVAIGPRDAKAELYEQLWPAQRISLTLYRPLCGQRILISRHNDDSNS